MTTKIKEAFLLCGGDSARLDFPKEMLRVDGAPLAAAEVRNLEKVCSRVGVITNRPAYLEHWLTVPLYPDEFPGLGPLAGIQAGLRRSDGPMALFTACDMPLVSEELLRRLKNAAAGSEAPALVPRTRGQPFPLPGVYARRLLPRLTERLEKAEGLSALDFVAEVGGEYVDLSAEVEGELRDVDERSALDLLRRRFREVEPLPVRRTRIIRAGPVQPEGGKPAEDLLAAEVAYSLRVNGTPIATLRCLPTAVRELAAGSLAYRGIIGRDTDIEGIEVDHEAGRILAAVDLEKEALERAGGDRPTDDLPEIESPFAVRGEHLLEVIGRLGEMAPVFQHTGATHQAAFSDGEQVLHFEEDLGRHNALDKVVGHCLLAGTDTTRGVLLSTGRLTTEGVTKALQQGVPVLASGSAPTEGAVELAEGTALTVVGFARGKRLNVYTRPQRIRWEEGADE